jgi:hypothetical protein
MKKYIIFLLLFIFTINYYQPFSYRISNEQLPGNLQRFVTEDSIDTNVYGPTAMVNGENFRFTLAEPITSFYNKISPIWLDFFIYKGKINKEQIQAKDNARYALKKNYKINKEINSLHLGNLSGSSTGLAYALAYITANYPNFLKKNQNILATGTINKKGDVFMVGSIEAKFKNSEISNMDIILGPSKNLNNIIKQYYKNHSNKAIIIGVDSIQEAINAICFINNNNKLPCNKNSIRSITLPSENIHLCNSKNNNRYLKCSWSVKGDNIIIK